ncbi:MAG: radical SAM protein [Candidatus Omnitrophota bacterium]
MTQKHYQYIFGPVYSWRLGVSLGIDPISQKGKTCNFDCLYCQLGKTTNPQNERRVFVPTKKIIEEIKQLPDLQIDYLTLTSSGEPTLAKNLGEIIQALRTVRKEKIAVITNASLMHQEDVRRDLLLADHVLIKLDSCSQETLEAINRPVASMSFQKIVDGIKKLKSNFQGKLSLQIMFVRENKKFAQLLADLAKEVNSDEVELNTPLRTCAVTPLSKDELDKLKKYFHDLPFVSVYDKTKKHVEPLNVEDAIKRHGSYQKE